MQTKKLKLELKPLDIMTLILIAYNIVIIIIGWKRLSTPSEFLLKYLIVGLLVILLNFKQSENRYLRFLQNFYPFFLFGFFFETSTLMNRIFLPEYLDPFFQRIDQFIFGYQPAIEWGIRHDGYFLQEIFHFGYFTFYLMIPGLAIYYYLKDHQTFQRYIFTICFILYACYVIYVILPVIGGRFWEKTQVISKIYRYGIFTRIMAFIYQETDHWGGAVPSSHVAAAIGVLLSVWKEKLKFVYVLLPVVVLLTISTVYCHYHYFIDALIGILFGIILFFAGEKIYRKTRKCLT